MVGITHLSKAAQRSNEVAIAYHSRVEAQVENERIALRWSAELPDEGPGETLDDILSAFGIPDVEIPEIPVIFLA